MIKTVDLTLYILNLPGIKDPNKEMVVSIVSVQFSCSVVSDSLRPRESQHARPPCPSPTPRVYSNSCPSSQWCHPAISSSVFSFSFSFSISPSSEHPELISLRMDWLDLLAVQGTLNTRAQKHQFFGAQLSSQSNSHIHTWPLEKPYPWLDRPLLTK